MATHVVESTPFEPNAIYNTKQKQQNGRPQNNGLTPVCTGTRPICRSKMAPTTNDIPRDERTRLLVRTEESTTGGNANANSNNTVAPAPTSPKKHTKRRNSDGSLDFERIVNGYSIQGE